MASNPSSKTSARPSSLRSTRSFSRPETVPVSSSEPSRPKRASTIQNGAGSVAPAPASALKPERDTFESRISEEAPEPPRASVDLEDLPIELIGLADSFIDGLSAKVHPTPPNIDNLSRMFQEFYATAANHIQTHVDSLATRQRREGSPAPSNSPRASAASLLRAKAASLSSKEKAKPAPVRKDSDQQMLTAEEYADRKRARKALEQKKGLLEEAVERRLCEGIYDRIYRHHSTQDEAQDDKLRSKTAALAVVGIGPADLGVDLGLESATPEALADRKEEVKNWLENARKELVLMNQSRYPLGKLNHLKAAHKGIIDTLSHFHPSSSADELMPMLIYTLITLPPTNLNVISDVNFIQRFRWEPKLVGEAAYCLTNLEATISFLETVDLSTLRADEAPSGPLKSSSGPNSPKVETFPPAYSPGLGAPATPELAAVAGASIKPSPSPNGLRAAVQLRNRRLSDLVNTPAQAIGAASDAVFTTADQGLKNIGNSLTESYNFLLGRLREQNPLASNSSDEVVVPKTLDDARKLIGTPPPVDDDGESASGASSGQSPEENAKTAAKEDRLLTLMGGARKVSRDHSADSSRSASSSKKLAAFASDEQAKEKGASAPGAAGSSSNPALIDSVRNFGNSINPMARFSAGIGGFRGFGRTTSTPAAPTMKDVSKGGVSDGGDLATAFPDLAASLPPKEIPKINPPVRRFMELQNPGELRLNEVLELLKDYRRLAGTLKDIGAFKE
ncbi:hypothetical protein GQ53DRAFT_642507 [Thozetella sp. PMI_491]|nr:hypothetical protein GQ53DRAFT_642507 [Thozetella sp. PMI_491]